MGQPAAFAQTTWNITAGGTTTLSTGTSVARLFVGGTASPGPTLRITSSGSLRITNNDAASFMVGAGGNHEPTNVRPFGTVLQEGGVVDSSAALYLADATGTTAYTAGPAAYTLQSGTILLTSTNFGFVVVGRTGPGVFTQNGGVIRASRNNGALVVGAVGSGTYTITSGTFEGIGSGNITDNAPSLLVANTGGNGRLTINGANAVMAFSRADATLAPNTSQVASSGTATVEILDGTLALNGKITRGRADITGTAGPGAVSFTLGGGTLRTYDANLAVGITNTGTGNTLREFDVTLAPSSLSTITGVGWKDGVARTVAIHSRLVGSGSIQFTGGTTQLLSASNSYTGSTIIGGTNATLALGANGVFNTSPTITVGNAGSSGAILDLTAKTGTFSFTSGQTVGGIGTIRMDTGDTARFAGTFAPGNSPGILTIDGGTALLSGTTQIEIFGSVRGTDYDAVNLINSAMLNYDNGVLALDFGSWLADQQSYQLFGSGSSTLLGNFSSVTIAGTNYTGLTFSGSNGVWTSQGTSPANQTLTFTAATGTLVIVPEPAAIALASIGIAVAAWASRRRMIS